MEKAQSKTGNRRLSIFGKIKARTRKDANGCWIWTGPTSGNGRGGGYPRMSLDGQTVAVHRVMFTHFFGFIPGKKQIDHICRNRLCCNPEHLQLVTHRENMRRRDLANANLDTFSSKSNEVHHADL